MISHDEGSESLEIQQLAALFARARDGALATLVLTGVVVVLLWGRVGETALVFWAMASALLEGVRNALAARSRPTLLSTGL